MSDDKFGSLIKVGSDVVIEQCDRVIADIEDKRSKDNKKIEAQIIAYFKKRHRFARRGGICRMISEWIHEGSWFVDPKEDDEIVPWLQKYRKDTNLSYWDMRDNDLSHMFSYYPSEICKPWHDTAVNTKAMAGDASWEGPSECYVYIGSEDYKTIFRWGKA